MKDKLTRLMAVLVLASLTACSSGTPIQNSSTLKTYESQKIPSFPGALKIIPSDELQWESVQLIESNQAVGGTDLMFLAELKNVGSKPLITYALELDLKDEQGRLLKSVKNLSIYPEILDPGESGFICELAVNSLADTDFSAVQAVTMEPRGKYAVLRSYQPQPQPNVTITDPALNENLGSPNLRYKVISNESRTLDTLNVICPVFSAQGELLTVIHSRLEDLEPGESKINNQMAVIFNETADYENASLSPYLYVPRN